MSGIFKGGPQNSVPGPERVVGGTLPSGASPARRHENRVLAGLPQAEFALLARHLHAISMPPGAVLQHQDHPLDYVYFPHEGLVSLLATTPEGAVIEAASIGRAGAVCPLHKSDLHEGFLTAVAQSAMRVSRIAAAQLQAALPESAVLARALRACREALLLQLRQNLVC